jgi:aspartate kinase
MPLYVQKFGGSSLATPEHIGRVAERVAAARAKGADLVVVVSAMGKTTNKLLQLARAVGQAEAGATQAGEREMALLLATGEQAAAASLALALVHRGVAATALTGPQAGIVTTDSYRDARVLAVQTQRLTDELAAGRVPVVAGFQGMAESGELTTLGRGGSDTTAAVIAAALEADACEIYTDVPGVFTADPRLVPEARMLERISYEEMFEMASTRGGVVHPRAVEFARGGNIPILVRHSQEQEGGTVILPATEAPDRATVTGVALRPDVVRLTLTDLPNEPGVLSGLLSALGAQGICVDDIAGTESHSGLMTAGLVVEESAATEAGRLTASVAEQFGARCAADHRFAKVTVVGRGLRLQPLATPRILKALAEAQINVHGISTSEVRVSLLIERPQGALAVRALHAAFDLERGAAVA